MPTLAAVHCRLDTMPSTLHAVPGLACRLMIATGVAVFALGGSAFAQDAVSQKIPEDAAKHVEQLPAAINVSTPGTINASPVTEVQADVSSTYTAQPTPDPLFSRPAPKPASSFAPARVQGPLPNPNHPSSNIRPLDSARISPQLNSPATAHKDFTYTPRPSALNNHDVSPSASSASLPPRARTADIAAPPRGGLSSPINKPSFAKSKHSPNASHAHTTQHAKRKTATNGDRFGAPPSSAAHAKLAGNKQPHATHGKSQAATSNK